MLGLHGMLVLHLVMEAPSSGTGQSAFRRQMVAPNAKETAQRAVRATQADAQVKVFSRYVI